MLGATRRAPRKAGGFALAVAVSALLFAWWAGVASAAPGTLEICKGGDQVNGQTFSFTVAKGANTLFSNVQVQGGGCSSSLATGNGNIKITEDPSIPGGYMMTGTELLAGGPIVRENDAQATVTVTVSADTETQIRILNAPISGTVKVCKISNTAAFLSKQYSFTINGTPVTANSGATAGTPGQCSQAITIQPGSKIFVTESVPTGQVVAGVTGTNTTILSQSLTAPGVYTVRIKVKINANVLTFDDEATGPAQTGTLEVCKSSGGDPFIDAMTGQFQFQVTDSTNTVQNVGVNVGQCSGGLTVAAGNVHVVETIPANTFLKAVTVSGAGSLGPVNLTNGEATVVVPVNNDTLVTFTDNANTATLKVCKYLTANSGSLAGQTFWFSVSDPAIPDGNLGSKTNPINVPVIASASSSGACSIVGGSASPLQFPVGSTATAKENLAGFGGYVTSNQPGDSASTSIVNGINSISITNQALGQIEICKLALGDYTNFVFTFTYKNTDPSVTDPRASGTVVAAPGHCSFPVLVPPGSYTITEVLSKTTTGGNSPQPANSFQFVASTAFGPTGDNRCSPAMNCGNPLTVTVPYFLSNDPILYGETTVFFQNKVQQATFKVCKLIAPGSETPFKNTSFQFTYGINAPATLGPLTVSPPYPGPSSCTGEVTIGAIINPNNTPVTVDVQEAVPAGGHVDSITVNNNGAKVTVNNSPNGHEQFNPGVGTNVVTYTNSFPGLPANP